MTRSRLAVALCAACGLLCGSVGSALAQLEDIETNYTLERFRLASDSAGVLDVESAAVLGHLAIDLGMWLGYSDDPLNVYVEGAIERERVASLVSHRFGGDLVGAVGLFDRVQLGLSVPIVLSQDQDIGDLSGPMAISDFGLGDVRALAKVLLLERPRFGFDAAVMIGVTLPTNGGDDYLGDSGPTFSPELAFSAPLSAKLRAALNVGLLLREMKEAIDLRVDDEIYAHLGAAYRVYRIVELDATASVATALDSFFATSNRNFAELRGGVTVQLGPTSLFAAAGAGLSEGFGTPDFRALFGARFSARAAATTSRRGDLRIADHGDGAGARDTDGDGIDDRDDVCPLEAETVNGVSDGDGCPDTAPGPGGADRDGDGIADSTDRCPDQAEDLDSFEDDDGCVDGDNDGDGVSDADDKCPLVAGPAPAGCPEPDADGDGVADRLDNCPKSAGSVENFGCTDKQLVRLVDGALVLIEPVYFLTDKSTIESRSYRVLRNVAAVLIAHPEIANLRVEGHTDDRGSDSYNQGLSERRAEAVLNFLVASGIEKIRLNSVGRGEAAPVASNATPEGQETNRRVEFHLE